jgi:hypothetical protein
MILVKRDWCSGADDATPHEAHIEDADWAHDTIDAVATIGAKTTDGIKRSSVVINRSTFLRCIESGSAGSARLLAAAGEMDAALGAIGACLRNDPDNASLREMQQALMDVNVASSTFHPSA